MSRLAERVQTYLCVPYAPCVLITNMSVNKLDKFVEKRNRKQKLCEYLWSHPNFTKGGSRQTMQPIIIQQDRAFLTELRNKRG